MIRTHISLVESESESKALSQNLNPVNILPPDCLSLIFDLLLPSGLIVSTLVNRLWNNQITNADSKLKIKIHNLQKIAFGPFHWAKFIKGGALEDREMLEAFSLLPANIHNILNRPCPVFTDLGKLIKDTHIFVYIPNFINGMEINLTNIGKLAEEKLFVENIYIRKKGYKFINYEIISEINKSVNRSHWILMSKNLINNSRSQSFVNQIMMVNNLSIISGISYKIPNTLDAAAVIFAHFLKSNEYLFKPNTYTRCRNYINRNQVIVGGFDSKGLAVTSAPDHQVIGVAVVWKL